MRKKISIFLMVFVLGTLLAGCNEADVSKNGEVTTLKNNSIYYTKSANLDKKDQGDNTNVDTTPKMIASIPEEKIYLYALQEQDPWYQGLVLSINGVNKFFDWKTVSRITFPPKLYYVDLNNDDKKELVIFLIEKHGTGMSRKTVHIINPENFSEYKVKDALDIIYDNINVRILSKKEMEIMINDTIYNVKIGDVPPELSGIYPSEIEKTFFHHYIDYYMKDNTLKAEVGVETKFLSYLGHIIIDYSFKDGEFKANKIVFEGNPKVTVTTRKLSKTK